MNSVAITEINLGSAELLSSTFSCRIMHIFNKQYCKNIYTIFQIKKYKRVYSNNFFFLIQICVLFPKCFAISCQTFDFYIGSFHFTIVEKNFTPFTNFFFHKVTTNKYEKRLLFLTFILHLSSQIF